MTRDELLQKIAKVESLYFGADSPGEANAAKHALDRLHTKLEEQPQEAEEFKFSLPDPWKRQLFLALVRRHKLQPYRRPRQRQQTVMVRVTQTYVDHVLWPQFCELSKLLHDYLNDATQDIITSGIHSNLAEADEQKQLPMS